jgi:serine/threonine protein kinase
MPPEQFGGQTLPASDLYALGATLIYLATGQSPDRLPQKEMRLLFEKQVSLSPHWIDWLKWLTEPSLDLRLTSAKQALAALEKSHSRASSLKLSKPTGSKVELIKTRQTLKILLPPQGFHWGLIPMIGFAIPWNAFLIVWYGGALAMWSSGGWFMALFAIGHLGVGVSLVWGILFTLFGTMNFQITESEVSCSSALFGLRCSRVQIADRKEITKIAISQLTYTKNSEGDNVAVPPKLYLWAGTKKFDLNPGNRLTPPELDWLANNLSQWLKLPIA